MKNIDKICEEYSSVVYRYLFCITHDEEIAKDLTQDTFYIAIKDINRFREDCSVNVWLCKIAKNLWYKYLRDKYKNKVVNIEDRDLPYEKNIEDDIIEKESKEYLYRYIHKLDDYEQNLIYYRISGELSFKQIGELMDKNETWARVTFYRTKEKLKRLIREEFEDEKK
ncbi:MAG: sigma-70 family RNA polymerase sigma factor [Clostridia bacterium]|nr:sigma-70 family RNA polymerase sigma factor [Clostridia bacterium]